MCDNKKKDILIAYLFHFLYNLINPVVRGLNMRYVYLEQQVWSAFGKLRATGKSDADPIF